MTRENFKKGMLILRETFPERFSEFDKTAMQVWYQLLHDLPDKGWERTVLFIARNHEKPPSPALVRKIARNNVQTMSAEEAWLQVTLAVKTRGYSDPPKFDDSALQATVEALGWRYICECPSDAFGSLRAHFYRTYDAMKLREETNVELLAIEQCKGVKFLESDGQSESERHLRQKKVSETKNELKI